MISSDYDPSPQKSTRGFQLLIPVLVVLMVFLVASRSPIDSDLWWHLRSGQVMIETGHPLITDMFSYTREGETWVNHSWLGEIILFGLYRLGGWTAISAWMGAMAALTAVFLWWQTRGNTYVKAGFILWPVCMRSSLDTASSVFFIGTACATRMADKPLARPGRAFNLVLRLTIYSMVQSPRRICDRNSLPSSLFGWIAD
jgi:hypothetical protein